MAKIKIEFLEEKFIESLQKKVLDVSCTDEKGEAFDATIWELDKDGKQFPNFSEIKPGHTIDCIVYKKGDGKITLYPPKLSTTTTTGGNKGGFIAKAQETKAQNIEKAQNNKELSIKIASTMSMACQTALAFIKEEQIKDAGVFKAQVKEWRKFYWTEWDKEEKDFSPF